MSGRLRIGTLRITGLPGAAPTRPLVDAAIRKALAAPPAPRGRPSLPEAARQAAEALRKVRR